MGKGKDRNEEQAERVSRPLTSLRDPSSFAPPPKRNTSPGGTPTTPSSRSLSSAAPQSSRQAEEEEDRPAPPPLPYRVNRSGLETNHLPPPPVRRDNADSPASSPSTSKPSLPPRLPARAPAPQSATPPPPPPYSETDNVAQTNPGAVSRLGQAGVSVPGLGIGRPGSNPSPTAQANLSKQVNALQSGFSGTSAQEDSQNQERSGTPQNNIDNNSPGSTVNNIRQRGGEHFDAGKRRVNDLNQKHKITERGGQHFETGKKKLSELNQKHKITDRVHSYFERPPAPDQESSAAPPPPPPPPHPNHPNSLSRQNSNIDVEALNKRKPPPPPPPAKKPGLQSRPVAASTTGSSTDTPSPPPLPLGTKPR